MGRRQGGLHDSTLCSLSVLCVAALGINVRYKVSSLPESQKRDEAATQKLCRSVSFRVPVLPVFRVPLDFDTTCMGLMGWQAGLACLGWVAMIHDPIVPSRKKRSWALMSGIGLNASSFDAASSLAHLAEDRAATARDLPKPRLPRPIWFVRKYQK
ncbi:hypothetical protein GE09DRAFT_773625 [Coniochaeta sp. 2T2.1]|nr:hypothetical protein GE09DRAFT_773625 [Coniochaeta sp. 2T2.1]